MQQVQYAKVDLFVNSEDGPGEPAVICAEAEANCVISLLPNGKHRPMIDLDFAASLVPSSTEGHFHLYLEGVGLSPVAYERLLRLLVELGILQAGNLDRFHREGFSVLRRPGVKKGQPTKEEGLRV